jgi:integrase
MDKAKRSKRVNFWITYRIPDWRDENGKPKYLQRREFVGLSIKEAGDAEGKRKGQKRENKIFDEILPEATMSFQALTDWYLSLEKVKGIKSYRTIEIYLRKFTAELGGLTVRDIKPVDLENLQEKRKREGLKPKTIDDEVNYAKSMIIKAFDNDMVGAKTLKTFRRVKRLLEGHANRRERVLSVQDFNTLHGSAPKHLQDILAMGYWTGMRKGEIISLTWDKIDVKERLIRLEASDTKEAKSKTVPIGEEVLKVLNRLPRPIHGGHVFLYNGKPIEKRIETALKTACTKAGITWAGKRRGASSSMTFGIRL